MVSCGKRGMPAIYVRLYEETYRTREQHYPQHLQLVAASGKLFDAFSANFGTPVQINFDKLESLVVSWLLLFMLSEYVWAAISQGKSTIVLQ